MHQGLLRTRLGNYFYTNFMSTILCCCGRPYRLPTSQTCDHSKALFKKNCHIFRRLWNKSYIFPRWHLFVQNPKRKHQKNELNLCKVNNKHSKTTSMTTLCFLFLLLLNRFLVYFEIVNARWVRATYSGLALFCCITKVCSQWKTLFFSIHELLFDARNPVSANSAKWSDTLKQFVDFCRRIIWVCVFTKI